MSQQEHWIAIRGRGHEYFKRPLCPRAYRNYCRMTTKLLNKRNVLSRFKDGEILNDSGSKATKHYQKLPRKFSLAQAYGRFSEALMAWRAMVVTDARVLTMLGIIIGIASVVSIMVIGDAAQGMVLNDIKSIGTNTISIYQGKTLGTMMQKSSVLESLRY